MKKKQCFEASRELFFMLTRFLDRKRQEASFRFLWFLCGPALVVICEIHIVFYRHRSNSSSVLLSGAFFSCSRALVSQSSKRRLYYARCGFGSIAKLKALSASRAIIFQLKSILSCGVECEHLYFIE